ncbi:MAG: flagellar protein FlaG [Gammaproteobacteria bacterium]|nr:flagellar protein FlaG [Gammaproteobacteria bacterium]
MSAQSGNNISTATGTFTTLTSDALGQVAGSGGESTRRGGKVLPPPANDEKPDMQAIARSLNKAPTNIGRDLRFEVNLDSGRSVIQVLDRDTGEIIRQIPPEKLSTYVLMEGGVAIRLFDELV